MRIFTNALLALTAFVMLGGAFPIGANAASHPKATPRPHRAAAHATPAPVVLLPNEKLLAKIREVFRSHRPPPPYVSYTITRAQNTEQGYPDYVESYTYHVWCRTSDRAALGRKVFRDDYRGPLEFQRPAFNEARDPGPPTADVFEPAPIRPRPIEFVPTPEPNAPPIIGEVRAVGETQYRVTKAAVEGDQIHVSVTPIRDPDRNRLREIYVDRKSYELKKLVATDKLFVEGDKVYAASFTIIMGTLEGRPIVTDIHGDIGDNYVGDGEHVEFHFTDIAFPKTLPSWYFDPHTYAMHKDDAPI